MAFWGIEVRPGKPYTHHYDSTRGRLRISQATLANGKSMGKSTVQCNVGNKSPILLCNLIPNGSETCHLELEFEEDDGVIFSILGQRSVHLSGYFIGSCCHKGGDETDSYGEDIAETDNDNSDSYCSEDEYESDFIDDGDIEMFPRSPHRKSGVVIEEIVEDEKQANGNANRRRLKKKNHVIDSDEGNTEPKCQLVVKGNRSVVLESEDEDGFPISFSLRKKTTVNNAEGTAKLEEMTLDEDRKRKIDAISKDLESTKEPCQPCDASAQADSGDVNNEKPKKKKKDKDRKPKETAPQLSAEKRMTADQNPVSDKNEVFVLNGDEVQLGKAKVETKENVLVVDVDGAENDGKPKKKKKDRVKRGKKSETGIHSSERNEGESKGDLNEALNNDIMDQDLPSNVELETLATEAVVDHAAPESSGNLKKKNKKKKNKDQDRDDTFAEIVVKVSHEESQQIVDDKLDVDNHEQQKSMDTDKMDGDLLVKQLRNDKYHDVNADPVADDVNQSDAKKKKKKKKGKNSEKDSINNQESMDMVAAEGKDEQKDGARSVKAREFANGLNIEELSMGKPDGKRASPGSKVFVHYIGKLKNGEIFDSNTGRKPFSFRLGIGEVIKGWDVGVNGMRVGDKRRLTVPPSMGYGQKGVGKIPGNSWLVFDVELVDVK